MHLKAAAIVFACRSEKYSAFKIGLFNNKLILWGIVFELIFVSILIYTPFFQKIFQTTGIGWKDWAILVTFMIIVFFLEELRKKIWKTTPYAHHPKPANPSVKRWERFVRVTSSRR